MAAASDGLGCLQRLSNASIGEAVPRMNWTSAAVQPVTLCRTPVILMNTITTTSWPAATLWMDPEYLLRKLPTLHEAYVVEPSEAAQPARRAAAGIDAPSATLVEHMKHDKKMAAGTLPFLLARGIGQTYLDKTVDLADVTAFLDGEPR